MGVLENKVDRRIDEMSRDLCSSLQQIIKQLVDVQQSLRTKGNGTRQSPSPTPQEPPPRSRKAPSSHPKLIDSNEEQYSSVRATQTHTGYKEYTPEWPAKEVRFGLPTSPRSHEKQDYKLSIDLLSFTGHTHTEDFIDWVSAEGKLVS